MTEIIGRSICGAISEWDILFQDVSDFTPCLIFKSASNTPHGKFKDTFEAKVLVT